MSSAAADKKARLLAKAAKQSQKPLGADAHASLATSTAQPHHHTQQIRQQQQRNAQAQQQQQAEADAEAAAAAYAAAPRASPASSAAASGYGSRAYTADDDDLDGTLYIDQDSDRMKLKNKTQLANVQSRASAEAQQQQENAKHFAAQRAALQKAALALPGGSPNSGPWEDVVESFDRSVALSSPARGHNGSPSIPGASPSAGSVGGRGNATVAVLDSAEEERRLDALRAKKERAKARARVGGAGTGREKRDSVSESAEYSTSELTPSASPPSPYHSLHHRHASASAGASSSAAAAATGWVDPQTRLQQVQVRAAAAAAPPQQVYEEDDEDDEGAEATHQAAEQEDVDAYQRALMQQQHQQIQDASAAASAAASSSASPAAAAAAATPGEDPNDPQVIAYHQQLALQAEQAHFTQQQAEAGELTPEELRLAMMRQKCRLIKRSGGFASFLHPRYELYTEEHQGGLFLATARKSSKTKPNYHLTTERFAKGEDKPIGKNSPHYAGKVAATLSRSDYIVYDEGFNPSKQSGPSTSASLSPASSPREEIGNISYKPHLSGKTPRKLAVLLPILFPDSHKDAFVNREFKNEFLANSLAYQHLWKNLQEAQQRARVPRAWLCLLNKPPRYHADTGQYVLDFCGRAPQVSVKNFQLVYPEEPDEVLFQLGRLDDENFSVDFRFPMAPAQAFAIALSSLDYKWTVD